jgi:hypothetical protein
MTDPNELPEEEEFGSDAGNESIDEFETMPELSDEEEVSWMDDVDPATIVTIRPSSGEAKFQVVEEPTSLSILMQRSGLTYNGQLDAYVEGTPIDLDTPIQGGQTVVLIGNVKGGK